jgi:FAD/FMN-containing dehydrogenase
LGSKRIQFERRVGKIGFMGRGGRVPGRQAGSDAPHGIGLRIGDERVSTSQADTEAARSGFSPIPGALSRLFSRTPEAVVRPTTAGEAAEAAGICLEEHTRMVPRGAATSGLGGVVPVRGGVVIDLTRLDRILDIDRKSETAAVEAGARWGDVVAGLEHEGFAPPAYPLSAGMSTVGGWASVGGYGAGTLRHGNFRRHIVSLEAALPSGFLVEATGEEGRYSIPSFAGTEGQMGVITRVTFSLRRAPERRATLVIHLKEFSGGVRLYEKLAALERPPFALELLSPGAARLHAESWGGPVLVMAEEGGADEVERSVTALRDALGGSGLEPDPSSDARALWNDKLTTLLNRREEAPFYSGGVIMGHDRLPGFISYILERSAGDPDLFSEYLAVDRMKTLVTVGYSADRRRLSPLRALARVRSIVDAGAALGGVPYGAGLWNSPYIDVILGGRKKELRRIKNEVDRLRIMNPGKFFSMTTRSGLRMPGWAMRAYFGIAGRS